MSIWDEINSTERDYADTDIVTAFRNSVQQNGNRTAVVFKEKSYTYAEIDELSERIAGFLIGQGIGKGDVVSIMISRSEYMPITSLGVLKTGAAYQPLDPGYPAERLMFMMEDAECKLLIADQDLLDRIPDYRGDVLLTKDIPSLPACEKVGTHPDAEDLFILLYTSGSTGVPKGVMLEHGNLVNFCGWYREYYQLDPECRVSAYASFGFDANMMETYPALTAGATLYIVEEEIRLDLIAMEAWFNKNRITHAFMTTQVARQFYSFAKVKDLRYLSTGGEKLVPVEPRADGPRLINLYGPTECTVAATGMYVDRLYDRVPIGKPLSNTRCYVVDEKGNLLPPMQTGELLIAGRGVGRGYLKRPDLTEKVFIQNPFSDDPAYQRAYRTGDQARIRPDGNIDFVGRMDDQVKVRGFRIELTEVESVIREYPGITDATVQAFEDERTGEKFIAAYVVSGDTVDEGQLKEFIRERKPAYMVPSVTMQIDAIPLNRNQKVDRKALPRPERKHEDYTQPGNEVQQRIYDAVAEALGHRDFGIDTDIFEAGLSSIGAIHLNLLLAEAFQIPVSIQDLQNHHTVEELEQILRSGKAAESHELREDYPLSETQKGILIECISQPDTQLYHIPMLFRLSPRINVQRLKEAVEQAIAAHPYLNAVVYSDDQGNFRVKRNDDLAAQVDLVETDRLPEDMYAPFQLLGGRLYRAAVYVTKEGNYLVLYIHHIVTDGSSMGVLIQDINDAYAGAVPEKETYTGYELALDEEELRKTEKYDKAREWFDGLLCDADKEMLPLGDVFGESESYGALRISSGLNLGTLESFLEEKRLSANAFFNAVFAYALSKFTGKKEALYTTIYNGRNDSRMARTVTMMVKTFPVLARIQEDAEIAAFVSDMGQQLMTSMASDLYSFAEIAGKFEIGSDIIFAYQGDDFDFNRIGGEKAEMIPVEMLETKAPLHIDVFVTDGQILYNCEHRKDIFSEEYIRRLVACLEKVASEFIFRSRLREICLADDGDLKEMALWNETKVDDPETDIVSMVRAAAAKYPGNNAVIFQDEKWTYKELDEISERIAGYLQSRGIGKGKIVSVLIPRSAFMVTVSLGVLKSGAAYQPLDPGYPTERLEFMMKDADCALLVAEKALMEKVPGYQGEILYTEEIAGLPSCETRQEPIAPEDLFILLYTSGSTGVPKGVMLEHRNLANFCRWYRDFYHLDETGRVAAYASYGFDACMMDMYPALTTGACVCIVAEEIRLDLAAMKEWFDRIGITHSFMTTQICRQFYTAFSVDSLRYLSGGGEALVPVIPKSGMTELVNGYGPTECTIFSTVMPVRKEYGRVPIGKPIRNYACYVVDENMRRLPPLMPGELVIAGSGVGRGYLGRPDLTEKVFIPNPFDDDPAFARAYRTGDVVRLLPDGNLDFLGRNDGQVKIRGFRIELTEVESVIRDFPGVRDATVQAFTHEKTEEKYIAAYIVGDHEIDQAALKDFIRERKPAYMVPAVIMQIDAIPLNQNQKVNKKALPIPARQDEESASEYAAPVTELQKKICAVFEYALGLDKIGIQENFFDVGGSSLDVAKAAVKATMEELPIVFRDVYEHPTVESMEKYVLSLSETVQEDAKPEVKPTEYGILEKNTPDHLSELETSDIGDVLLTGATGFLGIHVLKELIDTTDHRIFCMVQSGKTDPEIYLKEMLMYYFGSSFEELFGNRIIPVEGDLTDRDEMMSMADLPFRTVINCAACVKHFVADDLLDRVNWHGVENLIELCLKKGGRLVQISTLSVAGMSVNRHISPDRKIRENELFFGQNLDNKYCFSKFKAEEAILSAIAERGLNARIVRAGNLMPRYRDGEFQINSRTNAFMRTLRALATLKKVSVYMLDYPQEFSPIDITAASVVALASAENFSVYHASNSHTVQLGDVIESMNRCGIPVETVDEKEFTACFQQALKDEKLSEYVSPLLTYEASFQNSDEFEIGYDNSFTTKVLYGLRIKWPIINEAYLDRVFTALKTLGFFDIA